MNESGRMHSSRRVSEGAEEGRGRGMSQAPVGPGHPESLDFTPGAPGGSLHQVNHYPLLAD